MSQTSGKALFPCLACGAVFETLAQRVHHNCAVYLCKRIIRLEKEVKELQRA